VGCSVERRRTSSIIPESFLLDVRIAAIAAAVFLVILIALPFLINVNRFRPKIESEATNALRRPMKLGNLCLSILAGTVGIEDISIADDPAFSKSPS
jgi:AsmA protein